MLLGDEFIGFQKFEKLFATLVGSQQVHGFSVDVLCLRAISRHHFHATGNIPLYRE